MNNELWAVMSTPYTNQGLVTGLVNAPTLMAQKRDWLSYMGVAGVILAFIGLMYAFSKG